MYPLGTTCAHLSGAVYKTSYNAWGDANSRTYNSTNSSQTYDLLNHMIKWSQGTSQRAWYAYDASGQRPTNGTTTGITVYAFGAEEYQYDGAGNLQSSTHYYALGGRSWAN